MIDGGWWMVDGGCGMWDVGCGIWVMADASNYSPVGRLSRLIENEIAGRKYLEQEIDLGFTAENSTFRVIRDYTVADQEDIHAPAYFLPLFIAQEAGHFSESEGIVLQKIGDVRGQYRRLGKFRFFEEHPEKFVNLLRETGAEVAEAACARTFTNTEHPDERYVLTIV